METTFDENSQRSIEGIAFQKSVFEELSIQPGISNLEYVWDFWERLDPGLTKFDYACYEKEFGDITFMKNGKRYWVECCYVMAEQTTSFCEMKRLKFGGVNKYYCFGKKHYDEPVCFIRSKTWNSYVKKCPIKKRGNRNFRQIQVNLIGKNLRAGILKVDNFYGQLS